MRKGGEVLRVIVVVVRLQLWNKRPLVRQRKVQIEVWVNVEVVIFGIAAIVVLSFSKQISLHRDAAADAIDAAFDD